MVTWYVHGCLVCISIHWKSFVVTTVLNVVPSGNNVISIPRPISISCKLGSLEWRDGLQEHEANIHNLKKIWDCSYYSIALASKDLDIASFVSNAVQGLYILVQFFTNFSNTCSNCFLAFCWELIVVACVTSLSGPNFYHHNLQLRVENTHITHVTWSGLYRCSLGDLVVSANGIALQAV